MSAAFANTSSATFKLHARSEPPACSESNRTAGAEGNPARTEARTRAHTPLQVIDPLDALARLGHGLAARGVLREVARGRSHSPARAQNAPVATERMGA